MKKDLWPKRTVVGFFVAALLISVLGMWSIIESNFSASSIFGTVVGNGSNSAFGTTVSGTNSAGVTIVNLGASGSSGFIQLIDKGQKEIHEKVVLLLEFSGKNLCPYNICLSNYYSWSSLTTYRTLVTTDNNGKYTIQSDTFTKPSLDKLTEIYTIYLGQKLGRDLTEADKLGVKDYVNKLNSSANTLFQSNSSTTLQTDKILALLQTAPGVSSDIRPALINQSNLELLRIGFAPLMPTGRFQPISVTAKVLSSKYTAEPMVISQVIKKDGAGANLLQITPIDQLLSKDACVAATRPASFWRMDEVNGNIAYDSSGTKDATITGTTTVKGKVGMARQFNGKTSDEVLAPAPISATDNWTISAWVKPAAMARIPESPAITMTVAYFGDVKKGFGLMISDNKLKGLYGGQGWIEADYTFTNADAWYFIAMERENGTTKFFVNGEQTDKTSDLIINAPDAASKIGIGNVPALESYFYTGAIDEVGIYSKALSASEIKSLYELTR